MLNLIIEVVFSVLIVLWVLQVNQFLIKNKNIREFIINHSIVHPNSITVFRVLLGFIAMWLYYYWFELTWVLLYVFSVILDATDWVIARGCSLSWELWKSLDPLADKVVYFVALLYFWFIWKLSLVLIFIFVWIDVLWQFSRILLKKFNADTKANIFWKVKTTIVFTLIFYLMVVENKNLFEVDVFYNNVFLILWIVFAILSVVFKLVGVKK